MCASLNIVLQYALIVVLGWRRNKRYEVLAVVCCIFCWHFNYRIQAPFVGVLMYYRTHHHHHCRHRRTLWSRAALHMPLLSHLSLLYGHFDDKLCWGSVFGRVRRSTLWFPFSYRFFLLWFLQPTAFTGVLEDTKIHSLYPSRMPYDSFNTDTHKHGHAQCTATVQRERVMHLGLGLEFFFPFPIPSRAATPHAHHATIWPTNTHTQTGTKAHLSPFFDISLPSVSSISSAAQNALSETKRNKTHNHTQLPPSQLATTITASEGQGKGDTMRTSK